MTFDQIWQQLTTKRPSLERDVSTVEFTAGNLRRLLRQVYDQGRQSVPRDDAPSPFSAFGDIFGRR